ncbi:SDR family oxidoreductase [Brachyspira hyodysenteriae]|uniref:SDR family oxidoreductase n=1 Tax=Brachyspira hyodysenteriae TaxID=159 RepID=UPI0022CD7B55|nr:SDR family oxidoreductase [Brachyspira hyodysenteriae]MCZ9838523.1 SDR family oxidoreductase [Brachyspira hyodysenteriae]MCZ9847528.1 SDR family oxidoreductase [Brachyspira hyodysenteriae]MCZ9851263.1 SDR family oxidoreductase [Brachyspira hyodysenteriae]MCZ9860011.1 SDR family oxidoreductase [Brachyspira hyodysenteriae]MCZ9874275.1 SDR family oxidoreductase [Brachyspira hyodysenteriae]
MKKLVVITGASSGIGMETAKKFSENGYPTLLISRRKEIMEKLNLKNSISVSADVTNLEEIKNAVKIAEEKYGKTDLLINCAGVMLLGNIDKQSYEEWKNMIDVNVNGILTTTNIILPDMIKRNEGTIINISSIAGRKTFTNHGIYCGSKFAVHAITESIREEVADKNVRIIVIAPGVVETNLLSHTTDENIKSDYIEWKRSIGNGLNASDIVNCIEFAYNMPQDICVREIVIAKTKQVD